MIDKNTVVESRKFQQFLAIGKMKGKLNIEVFHTYWLSIVFQFLVRFLWNYNIASKDSMVRWQNVGDTCRHETDVLSESRAEKNSQKLVLTISLSVRYVLEAMFVSQYTV